MIAVALINDRGPSSIHEVAPQDLLLEEVRFILLGLLWKLADRLLYRGNRRSPLVTAGLTSGRRDRATQRRGTLGPGAQGLGPVEAFAWSARCVRWLIRGRS